MCGHRIASLGKQKDQMGSKYFSIWNNRKEEGRERGRGRSLYQLNRDLGTQKSINRLDRSISQLVIHVTSRRFYYFITTFSE